MVPFSDIIRLMSHIMAETTMPAAEAAVAIAQDDERNSYEFAFHVLPTVAEEEVPGVFEEFKALINKVGGEVTDGESPERIELAYPITKGVEGKNRVFPSAYFGWIRFKLEGEKLEGFTEAVEMHEALLRYLILKLTKLEESAPFRFHENRKSVKMVTVVDEGAERITERQSEVEENVEVSEKALDESLDKITSEDDEQSDNEPKEETKE